MAGFYSCLKSKNDYIMATGPAEVIQTSEAGETTEECTGKKKSKFQTFKNFFAKKKRKEPPAPRGESNLKPSQSSSDVSISALDTAALHSPAEAGSKGSLGNKALSHDSVFIFETAPENAAGDASSQENIPGRVKTLQLQLQQNIRLGSPPLVITSRKVEDPGAVSEDDGLPRSPPEISTLHEVLTGSPSKSSNPVQRHSSLSLGGTDSEDEQIPSEAPSAVLANPASQASNTLPVDFSTPASPVGCLDTSAAKHRIALNPRKQRVFTSKNQQILVEQLENESSSPEAGEKKKSLGKLLDSDQQETNWEGSAVQEERNVKGSSAKELPTITKATDVADHPWSCLPMAEVFCTVLQEDSCFTEADDHRKVSASCLKVQPSLVKAEEETKAEEESGSCCFVESIGEFKLHQQNTDPEEIEPSGSLQAATEAAVFLDMLTSDLGSHCMEKEAVNAVEDAIQGSVTNLMDQSDKESEDLGLMLGGKAEDHPCTTESSFIQPNPDPALCISQVHLAILEASAEREKMAVSMLEDTLAPKDVKETCEFIEFKPPTDHVETEKSSSVSISDVDCMLPQSKASKELPSKTPCPVSKISQGNQQTGASDNLEKPSVGCLASSSLAGFKSYFPSNGDVKENQSSNITSQKKRKKESKSSDSVKTPLKSAATKPVRFTIAPAWQRSLSGGSSSKEDSCARSSPTSPIRPEFFEGTAKEHAYFDAAMQEPIKNSPEGFDKGSECGLNSCMEWAENVESPFGVRLRRTSSLLKYHSDAHNESPKLIPSTTQALAPASLKEDHKVVGTGKPSQGLPSSTKSLAKKSDLPEGKSPPRSKPEEVTKKQHGSKPSEKVPGPHLETTSSEPAWVSMAKLKQKGFQGHPFAKGHKVEDRPLTKMDQEEQVTCASDNLLRKSAARGLCPQEKKSQMKITSAAAAGAVGSAAQEASGAPTAEKETRQSSNLPMTPCSPVEPPWLSLAKKKAKAWSEMPQIVQ
ncbi:acrosomal protein KIAA1210 homolog isoform X1 [Alligator mississippiensis]|uniref:DUF4592 domain-containing protein n=2 Tax=Alligator mississippiensis TaxID=8496 RepID=A0A151NMY9_ALLMI|nr:acrosomal protein KIAA1210 homolog isoform X1 [Alligator mississippiensis]KYO38206.1 hypothetical protein Y1Q_0015495 [Alligator mississippiensis]